MREGAYCAGSVAKDQTAVELATVQFAATLWHAVPGQRWRWILKLDKRNLQRCKSFHAVRTGLRVVNFALIIQSQNFPSVTIIRCLLDLLEE